jgi:hypothetical protein
MSVSLEAGGPWGEDNEIRSEGEGLKAKRKHPFPSGMNQWLSGKLKQTRFGESLFG